MEGNSWNWVIQYQPHPICDFGGQSLLSLQVHCLPPVKHTSLQGLQCSDRKKRKRWYSDTLFGIEWYNTKPILFATLTDNLCYLCKDTAYHLLNTHHCRAYSALKGRREKDDTRTRFLELSDTTPAPSYLWLWRTIFAIFASTLLTTF